jgi:hypothetical protein
VEAENFGFICSAILISSYSNQNIQRLAEHSICLPGTSAPEEKSIFINGTIVVGREELSECLHAFLFILRINITFVENFTEFYAGTEEGRYIAREVV